ncbi:MAG: GspH/FimT family pseudopilin [Pseudomonadales bacterium]
MNIPLAYKGFTLIELMVTLVVASILLVMALPNFTEMIRENQTSSEANKLIRDLNLARSESVQRGISVSMCRSNTGAGCAGANWQSGWIVFTDINSDRAVSAGDQLLQVNDGLDTGFTMPVVNLTNGVTFGPDGSANAAGTFQVLPPAGGSRVISVNAAGRVTVAAP